MKKLIAVLLALSCMLIGAAAVAETLNIAYMPNYGRQPLVCGDRDQQGLL